MNLKSIATAGIALGLSALTAVSCSEKKSADDNGTAGTDSTTAGGARAGSGTGVGEGAHIVSETDRWLRGRYGPASGIVRLQVGAGEEKTLQVRYFERHGATAALHWYFGPNERAPSYVAIVDNGRITKHGPGDSVAVQTDWKADPNTTMPNFRALTSEMRNMFKLKELPARTFLNRKCDGYRLTVGSAVSDVWVWEGIMLYGEMQGSADGTVQPVVVRAISVDTTSTIPPEVFELPDGIPVKSM